jgi:hypothetical protein
MVINMSGRTNVAAVSRAIDRHRRSVVVFVLVVSAVAPIAAVRSPGYRPIIYGALGGLFLSTFIVALVIANVLNRRRPRTLDLAPDAPAFETPRLGSGVLMGLTLVPLAGLGSAVGWTELAAGRHRTGWVLGLVVALAAAGFSAWTAWRGVGVRLTRDGLAADGVAGSVFVPWEAFDPDDPAGRVRTVFELPEAPRQPPAVARLPDFARLVDTPVPTLTPRPVPPARDPEDFKLHLRFIRPELVRRRGWTSEPAQIAYEGVDDDFLAGVIRHYAAHPGSRSAIGTAGELQRLRAVAPPPADLTERPVIEPGTTRTGIVLRILIIAGALVISTIEPLPGWLQLAARVFAAGTAFDLSTRLHLLTWLRHLRHRT